MTDLNKNATSDVRIAAEHPRLSDPAVEHAPSLHSVSSKSTGLRQRRASGRRRGPAVPVAAARSAVPCATSVLAAAAGCCAARHDIRSVMCKFLPDPCSRDKFRHRSFGPIPCHCQLWNAGTQATTARPPPPPALSVVLWLTRIVVTYGCDTTNSRGLDIVESTADGNPTA